MPNAAKIRHVQTRPRVSLNLDSNGNGAGIIIVGGSAAVDAVDPRKDGQYLEKYKEDLERFGLTEAIAAYSTRLRIGIDKVWTAPTEA